MQNRIIESIGRTIWVLFLTLYWILFCTVIIPIIFWVITGRLWFDFWFSDNRSDFFDSAREYICRKLNIHL